MTTHEAWFVRSGDQEFGPLSQFELQTLASKGTFGPSSFASTDRQTWRLLRDIQIGSTDQATSPMRPRPLLHVPSP